MRSWVVCAAIAAATNASSGCMIVGAVVGGSMGTSTDVQPVARDLPPGIPPPPPRQVTRSRFGPTATGFLIGAAVDALWIGGLMYVASNLDWSWSSCHDGC